MLAAFPMTNQSETVSAVKQALRLLKGMGALSPSTRLGQVAERASQLFSVLDSLLSVLPQDTPDDVLEEVERVVETLHNVDQSWPACGDGEAQRLLDLAAARLRRIAKRLS